METKKWEALLTAVECGSFTCAAEALGYTQSGLTHMMNSLEKEVGFPLLKRGHYGVRLTAAGEKLLSTIQEFTRAGNLLEREIQQVYTQRAETLRVGAYPSIASHWLPSIVQRFRADHSGVHVDIHLLNSVQEMRESLLSGRVDMALGGRQKGVDFSTFTWRHLKDDAFLAVLPRNYPIGRRHVFPMREFEEKEFLVSAQGFDPNLLDTMEELGIHPDIRPSAMDDLTVISLVAHGLGVSMLTELVLGNTGENILAMPVSPPSFRELGILTLPGRDCTSLPRQFIAYIEAYLQCPSGDNSSETIPVPFNHTEK